MSKPKPPVFNIPIGHGRRKDGKIVHFKRTKADSDALGAWVEAMWGHPDTIAAGACVIIGHSTTMYFDLGSRTVVPSPTTEGAWEPSAISDYNMPPGFESLRTGETKTACQPNHFAESARV